VRTFAPFVAGVARMTYPRYFLFDLMGGVIWVFSLVLAGYWFGNLPVVKNNLTFVILAIVGLSMLPIFLGWLKSRRRTA
jgi:membrane-associated protein